MAWGWLCGAYAPLSHLTHGLWGEEVLALTSLPLELFLPAVGWEQVASQGCLQQFRHRDSSRAPPARGTPARPLSQAFSSSTLCSDHMLTGHTGKAQFWVIFQQISIFLGFLPGFFFNRSVALSTGRGLGMALWSICVLVSPDPWPVGSRSACLDLLTT